MCRSWSSIWRMAIHSAIWYMITDGRSCILETLPDFYSEKRRSCQPSAYSWFLWSVCAIGSEIFMNSVKQFIRSYPWVIALVVGAVFIIKRCEDAWNVGWWAETALFARNILHYGVPRVGTAPISWVSRTALYWTKIFSIIRHLGHSIIW